MPAPCRVSMCHLPPVVYCLALEWEARHTSILSVVVVPLLTCGAVDLINCTRPS